MTLTEAPPVSKPVPVRAPTVKRDFPLHLPPPHSGHFEGLIAVSLGEVITRGSYSTFTVWHALWHFLCALKDAQAFSNIEV